MILFNDQPIFKKEDDELNRVSFAERIAKYLVTNQNLENIVISLNGPWGSGKTSIINLIKENINIRLKSDDKYAVPIIVNFSPWNAITQDNIINQFFNVLCEHFNYSKIKKFLSSSGKILTLNPITKIMELTPIPSSAIKAIKRLEYILSEYIKSLDNKNGDLIYRKKQVEEYLKKSKLHFIVFIDDLDRLNDSEIKLIFQLIKSICGFSNITYFLAYDKNVISKALDDEQLGCDGSKYLEKLVQVEFVVPQIRNEKLLEIADNDLQKLLGNRLTDLSKERLNSLVFDGLFKIFNNIREEKRFINYLNFYVDAYYKEIDLTDIIGISFLKFLDENIIEVLVSYQSWLFGKAYVNNSSDFEKNKKIFYDKLNETRYKELNAGYLYSLFPNMFGYSSNEIDGSLYECRISQVDRFNLFLNSDLRTSDISMKDLSEALSKNNIECLVNYANSLNAEQGRAFLMSLLSFSKMTKDEETFKILLEFLFSYLSKLSISEKMFLAGPDYFLESICSTALNNLDVDVANNLIIEAVRKSTDVYSLISFTRDLGNTRAEKLSGLKKLSESSISSISSKAFELLYYKIDTELYSIKDAARIINYGIAHRPKEIEKLIDKKDETYIISFINKIMFIGRVSSQEYSYNTYAFNLDYFRAVASKWENKLNYLFDISDNHNKLGIIVLMMQISGIEFSNDYNKSYTIKDIKEYSKNNNLIFDSSEYEN